MEVKAAISRSRLTTRARVGVWTRPIDNTPSRPDSLSRSVMARVAFMPMSQSAYERARAESLRLA